MKVRQPVNTNLPTRLDVPRSTWIRGGLSTVGERIRARQRVTRVTNEELAAAADVHVKTVSQWRHDRQTPTDDNLAAIAPLLDCTFFYLKHGREAEPAAGEEPEPLAAPNSRIREMATREGYRVYPAGSGERLKPRVYERVYSYIERMRKADCTPDQIDEAERLLFDSAFSKLNKSDLRIRTEDEQLLDIDAAWEWIRRTIREHEGKDL